MSDKKNTKNNRSWDIFLVLLGEIIGFLLSRI